MEVTVDGKTVVIRDFVIVCPQGLLCVKDLKRKGKQAEYHGAFEITQSADGKGFYLINLVENHTRTERHLEQYSHIGNQDNKEHAREIQEIREEQIDDLRDKLNGNADIQTREEQIENLERRYELTKGYIKNNKEDMSDETLRNLEEKQQKRRIQLDNLKDY